MKLKYLFSYNAGLEKPLHVGQGSNGVRDIFKITGGKVWGPELNGDLLPFGGEFELTDSDGCYHIDVRLVIQTDDGANIYVQYTGYSDLRDAGKRLRSQGYTDFGDNYFVTRPTLETGHEKYKWLNNAVCIAEGRAAEPLMVEYRVYQCMPTQHMTEEPEAVEEFEKNGTLAIPN